MNRGRRDAQAGFSLVELLVVMVIFSVIGGIVAVSITSALRTSTRTQARIEAVQELEITVQRMSREIRAAAPIEVVSGDPDRHLQARVRRDGNAQLESFRLDAEDGDTALIAETFDVVEGSDTEEGEVAPTASRTLVTLVDNGDQPVFTYFNRAGVRLQPEDDLTVSSWVEIALVRDLPGQRPVEVRTTVAVRSVRYAVS